MTRAQSSQGFSPQETVPSFQPSHFLPICLKWLSTHLPPKQNFKKIKGFSTPFPSAYKIGSLFRLKLHLQLMANSSIRQTRQKYWWAFLQTAFCNCRKQRANSSLLQWNLRRKASLPRDSPCLSRPRVWKLISGVTLHCAGTLLLPFRMAHAFTHHTGQPSYQATWSWFLGRFLQNTKHFIHPIWGNYRLIRAFSTILISWSSEGLCMLQLGLSRGEGKWITLKLALKRSWCALTTMEETQHCILRLGLGAWEGSGYLKISLN